MFQPAMMCSTSAKKGFTLIELLTVMAIVAILLVLALPAFTSLGKASKVSAGIRQVSNGLSLARQYAITKRTKTRVLFPYSATTNSAFAELQYRSFAVASLNRELNTWSFAGKWETLPLGVIVYLDTNTVSTCSQPYPLTNSLPEQFAMIEFGPTGAALPCTCANGARPLGVRVTEGLVVNGNPMSNSANYADVLVDTLVGQIRVQRP